MELREIVFYVTIYSFLGWCVEVIFHTVNYGEFSNRGFVGGPVCTIYGVGFTGIAYLLKPFRENAAVLFAVSVALTTILEFLTGWVLEKVFHEKWWDYSKEPFNVKGYICLKFSLIWGLACTGTMMIVHPIAEKLYHWIPGKMCTVLLSVAFAVYVVDWSVTVIEIRKLKVRIRIIKMIADTMDDISDYLGTNLHESTLDVMERGEAGMELVEDTKQALAEKKEALALTMAENREIFLGRMEYEIERLKKNMNEAREEFTKNGRERLESLMNTLNSVRGKYKKTSFKASRTENRLAGAFPALDLRKKNPGRGKEEKNEKVLQSEKE